MRTAKTGGKMDDMRVEALYDKLKADGELQKKSNKRSLGKFLSDQYKCRVCSALTYPDCGHVMEQHVRRV